MPKLDKEARFNLKVMINKEKSRVLFAEADSDFAEALFSFLALPLGDIVKNLKKNKAPFVGSLTTLYEGLRNLNNEYFWTDGGKQMLLNPRSTFFSEPIKCFRCSNRNCRKRTPNVSMYYGTRKCDCGALLSRPMGDMAQAAPIGIFAEKQLHFLLTDDLQIAPIEPGSMIQTLIDLGIAITAGAELMNVTLGYNEMMDLLKGSLLSKTPLTDIILHKNSMNFARGDAIYDMDKEPSTDPKKMIVKAFVQQSTNKLVFVEAEEDFVDFLFSFLTLPLSVVEWLLDSKTSIRNIDNLYGSIVNIIDNKYFSTPDAKNRLIKPELPPNYLSKNQIFSLSEQKTPSIYFFERNVTDSSDYTVEQGYWMCFKDPKGEEGSYVKRVGRFMVFDDLTVKPWSIFSAASVQNQLNIPSSDVKELELQIGLKEGLNILKSSLASASALTDGLMKSYLEETRSSRKLSSVLLHSGCRSVA